MTRDPVSDTIMHYRAAAEAAREAQDFKALVGIGDQLERHMDFPQAWRCLADGAAGMARRKKTVSGREWNGETDPGRLLLVLRLMRHVGAQLRMARAVARLARSGLQIILCVEPRLKELFSRSFPEITVVDTAQADRLLQDCDYWASYERIAQFCWTSALEIETDFQPLQANPGRVAQLREAYGWSPGRLHIGISWYSSNDRKDLPTPENWHHTLTDIDHQILSLQYNPQEANTVEFSKQAGCDLLVDPKIDPVNDLDGCAAQIATTDVVLTISNTTAHMAGAMGHRCIVLLDDKDHLIWPKGSDRSVYYPKTTLLRQAGRPWSEVMRAATVLLEDMSNEAVQR